MENTRRSFLKKVSAAGIGAAGLAMAGNAGATTGVIILITALIVSHEISGRKKQPVKMMVNYVSVSSERVLDAMSILIMYWRSPVIRS